MCLYHDEAHVLTGWVFQISTMYLTPDISPATKIPRDSDLKLLKPRLFPVAQMWSEGLSITLQAEQADKNLAAQLIFFTIPNMQVLPSTSVELALKTRKKTQLKPGQNCNSHQLWLMTRRLLQHFSRATEDAGLQTGQKSEQIFTVATREQSWCCLTCALT